MQVGFGVVLGIIVAILKAIDALLNKSLSTNKLTKDHSFFCICFTIPFLLCMALFNWKFEATSLAWVFLYSLIETVNIFCHQKAVKMLNPIHTEVLSKSKTIMIYFVSIIFCIESVSLSGIAAILLFMVGVYCSIDFSTLDRQKYSSATGYVFEIISVVARTIKPFILRKVLLSGTISNEVLVLLSMVIAGALIFVFMRPELSLTKDELKKYTLRAGLDAVSMELSGYAVLFAGALLTSMLENFSIFMVAILFRFIYKKKFGIKMWVGITLVMIGLLLFSNLEFLT